MYPHKCTHSSDLSWGVRPHSFIYLGHMLSYVTVRGNCTICILNLFLFIADLFHNDTLSFLGGKTQYQLATSLETEPETDFHIFVLGVDRYLGGAAAACFGWGLVATPRTLGHGKCLTKFVFLRPAWQDLRP